MSTWHKLIHQAETLLGGPTPFMNLTSVLSSEAGFLASRARSLAATVDHPFFSTVRACLRGNHTSPLFSFSSNIPTESTLKASERPSGGLIILLFGQSCANSVFSTNVRNRHRSLAEIFETVHMAIAIHKSLIDLGNSYVEDHNVFKNMEIVNKLATLSGDVLLASVSSSLAKFHHAPTVDIISEAIGNMTEAEFYPLAIEYSLYCRPRSVQDPLDKEKHINKSSATTSCMEKWLSYVKVSRGAILGSCCQASLFLIEQNLLNESSNKFDYEQLCCAAKRFGVIWACLLRLVDEREHIQRSWLSNGTHSVDKISFHAQNRLNSTSPYTEFGLLEPTFAHAYALEMVVSPYFHINDILGQYNLLAHELSAKLRNSFIQLVSNARPFIGSEVENIPTMQLLQKMVEKLISESKCTIT